MKRGFTIVVLAAFMAACVSWPRGKVFKTAPQRWDYEELGHIEATGFGWTKTQAINRAARSLEEQSDRKGGNGVVGTDTSDASCYYVLSGFFTALMFPPCWASVSGAAVRFAGRTMGDGREQDE